MENKIEVINKDIYKKMNDFYKSSNAMIFFLTIITIFSLVQMVLFFTNVMPVNHTYFNGTSTKGFDPQKKGLLYFSFILSITGAISGFIGGVFGVRKDPRFIGWATYQSTCTAITSIIMGSLIYGIFTILIIITNFIRIYVWIEFTKKEITLDTKRNNIIILLVGAVVIIGMLIMVSMCQEKIYGPLAAKYPWYGYFDVLGAVLNLMGIIFLLIKSRVAFPIFLTAKVFLLVCFGVNGQIIPIIQMLLFAIMDVTSFLSWSLKEEEAPS